MLPSGCSALSMNDSFSLSAYQRACAVETSKSLDGSRLHFQILFVDDDNAKGRIAEGLLARVAEHNDAMFVLFPASATIASSRNAPRDAAAPEDAVKICESLGLCSTRCTMIGTSFDLSYLDEYDLIVAMDEDIRSLILRSLPHADQEYYSPRCRLLSEFLSPEFCKINNAKKETILLNMLDSELFGRVAPLSDSITDRSSNVFFTDQGEAALILASAGLTRFCLDTIDVQFEASFQSLLQANIGRNPRLQADWDLADEQLRRCSAAITGYFSPAQRKTRFEEYLRNLRLQEEEETKNDSIE